MICPKNCDPVASGGDSLPEINELPDSQNHLRLGRNYMKRKFLRPAASYQTHPTRQPRNQPTGRLRPQLREFLHPEVPWLLRGIIAISGKAPSPQSSSKASHTVPAFPSFRATFRQGRSWTASASLVRNLYRPLRIPPRAVQRGRPDMEHLSLSRSWIFRLLAARYYA